MQEETNEKTIALYIKTGKLTAQQLQKAMKALLAQMKKQHDKQKIPHGKQTLKQLMKQNAGVSNIEITKDNIKAFESTAKKYGIDFALKKDSTETPPRYLVFFKGRDADALTAAFKEFSAKKLTQEQKEGLQPVDKTVIDRAVRNVYRDYLADPDPEKMPILGDLYDELLKQPEPEAARIAAALELYVSGSLNVFNHRTNVELSNRLVCFDIKQLGKQLKKLGMLIVQDQIWNRVTINRAEKKSTRYYMDEFHLLLKEEQTAAYSVEIWKRFRKWGGIPTAITQNIKDLLASREVENIFENSDFVLMLNQAQGDRAILAKQLNISPQQMKYVTHTEAGEGLIFYGNVVLPFVDHFPKDTELYRIMTTKPEEVSSL